MKRFTNLFIAIGGGLLLWAAWPVSPLSFLIFVAFLPLLWLESTVKSRKKFFWLTYIMMFTWNVATTWWIWNASIPGGLAAFFANSFIMCLPWLGYRVAKKWLGEKSGYIALVAFWMCFEYIHLTDWGLSWPWLTLGNAFATHPQWVQWYEYTGTSGGTLWVLLSNILFFSLIKEYRASGRTKKYFTQLVSCFLVLILPLLVSLMTKSQTSNIQHSTSNIVVVQPNIDPYVKVSEAAGSFESQLQILISTSEKMIDDNTALLVWPETALYMASRFDEGNLKESFMDPFWAFLKRHPHMSLFTGIESFRKVDHKTKYSEGFDEEYNEFDSTIQQYRLIRKKAYYESYNGSMLVDSAGASAFYHKSMLVPGVETLPWFLRFIAKWFEKFGGTAAGYAKQNERTVLVEKNGYRIAPAICYESIYGEFMAKYVKNGANLICIITNDGWWKKTPGHKQHMNYARLRAIETRTWVARSANTGISCFIDPNGTVIDPQAYDTEAAIKLNIPVGVNNKTFFVKNGDILSKIMISLSILLTLWTIILKIRKRFFKPAHG